MLMKIYWGDTIKSPISYAETETLQVMVKMYLDIAMYLVIVKIEKDQVETNQEVMLWHIQCPCSLLFILVQNRKVKENTVNMPFYILFPWLGAAAVVSNRVVFNKCKKTAKAISLTNHETQTA